MAKQKETPKRKQKAAPKAAMKEPKEKKEAAPDVPVEEEPVLPQNILQMGEHAEEEKRIYILQKTYKEIRKFTKNKTQVESGGMLVGETIEEFGKTNIMVRGFIEAKYSEGTPTTLKFTHETWEYVHAQMDKSFRGMKIVGWIHTHPNFGIFLSEYDKFIQGNFFSDDNQIAYVVDPIQKTEGFFFWKNEEIERCKGFYIFDNVGVEISIPQESQTHLETQQRVPAPQAAEPEWRLWLLYVAVAVLVVLNVLLFSQLNTLKTQQESLQQSVQYLAQQQRMLYYQIVPGEQTTADTTGSSAPEPAPDASAPTENTTADRVIIETVPGTSAQAPTAEAPTTQPAEGETTAPTQTAPSEGAAHE